MCSDVLNAVRPSCILAAKSGMVLSPIDGPIRMRSLVDVILSQCDNSEKARDVVVKTDLHMFTPESVEVDPLKLSEECRGCFSHNDVTDF